MPALKVQYSEMSPSSSFSLSAFFDPVILNEANVSASMLAALSSITGTMSHKFLFETEWSLTLFLTLPGRRIADARNEES